MIADRQAAEILADKVWIDEVAAWREKTLKAAGYTPGNASWLARDHDVDLHLAVRMLEAGCDQTTAMRILT